MRGLGCDVGSAIPTAYGGSVRPWRVEATAKRAISGLRVCGEEPCLSGVLPQHDGPSGAGLHLGLPWAFGGALQVVSRRLVRPVVVATPRPRV